MIVEMLKPHNMLAVGDKPDLDPPIAELLIQRGVAVRVVKRRRGARRAPASEILQPEA